MKIPFELDIHNLIDDLRNFSWEASKVMLYYAREIKDLEEKKNIIKTKRNEDPVTLADLKVNELIIQRINQKYPNYNWGILSEENVKFSPENRMPNSWPEWLWVLDPLDGTKDFIQGTGNYAMHIALNFQRRPLIGAVLIPEKDELWISNGEKVWCDRREHSNRKLNSFPNDNLNKVSILFFFGFFILDFFWYFFFLRMILKESF